MNYVHLGFWGNLTESIIVVDDLYGCPIDKVQTRPATLQGTQNKYSITHMLTQEED